MRSSRRSRTQGSSREAHLTTSERPRATARPYTPWPSLHRGRVRDLADPIWRRADDDLDRRADDETLHRQLERAVDRGFGRVRVLADRDRDFSERLGRADLAVDHEARILLLSA